MVPVFTAMGKFPILRGELVPNSKDLALLSDNMSEIIYGTPSGKTFLPKIGEERGLYSSKVFPLLSTTLRIGCRSILYPLFAKTP